MEKHNELTFQIMVEASPNAIILADSNGRITLINKQTELLFGYTREEIIGKDVDILLPEKYKKGHPKLMKMFFTNPKSRPMGVGRDLFAQRKDGSEFPIEIGLSPINRPEGLVVLTSIIDITERKKTEELQKIHLKKIENKNKELEQFTSIASHDLRAPLQSIGSFANLLSTDHSKNLNEEGAKSLEYISDAVARMTKLIDGLLDYGQIGNSSELKKLNCNIIVANALADLHYAISKSNAVIEVNELPKLLGYETELRLLFQNLIANAIKFKKTDENPKIIVAAEKQASYWRFTVTDNGIGISPEYQQKIFAIFHRLHKTSDYEGSGIGLAHCKKIVELHNGEIGVESLPGVGSTFYFTINTNLELE